MMTTDHHRHHKIYFKVWMKYHQEAFHQKQLIVHHHWKVVLALQVHQEVQIDDLVNVRKQKALNITNSNYVIILNIASINEKCNRKETWEKLRQKTTKIRLPCDRELSDVWIRRESVYTQTQETEEQESQEAVDSSSGLEDSLPRTKPPRPTNLPLGNLII